MKKSLAAINDIIRQVEQNLGNSDKLKELCDKLEDHLSYVETDLHYHYNLFLVEIYGTKLQQASVAEKLCREVMQDPRTHVKVEGILRLSYLFSIENKYNQAIQQLQRVIGMTKNQPEIQMIAVNFFTRLMESSRDSNILKGLKCEKDNKFEQALEFYNQEFDCEQIFGSDQNRYFTATSIKRLVHIFKEKKFAQLVDVRKCEQFLQDLEKADMGETDEIESRYHERKKYLSKIIQFISTHQKRKVKEYDVGLCAKKILAIFKLRGALAKMSGSKGPVEEIKKSLKDLESNKISNPNMLNEFVKKEFEKYKKANEILHKMTKNKMRVFFHALSEEEQVLGEDKNKMTSKQYKKMHKNTINFQEQRFPRTQSVKMEETIRDFSGSYLVKVNEHSSGHEKRYFYFDKKDLSKSKMKLFYTSKHTKISKSDDSYQIKNLKTILLGKSTRAFQRGECDQFQHNQCFSLEFKDGEHKNFYVPDKQDFEKWIAVFNIFYENNRGNKMEKSSMKDKKKEEEKSKSQNKDMTGTKFKSVVFK